MGAWRISEFARSAVDAGLSSSAAAVPLKWAHDKQTGVARYIHDPEVIDAQCICICPACELVLTPVLAGLPLRQQPTAHFRHPIGSKKDDCSVVSARLAVTRHLLERGEIELPRRRMSRSAQGFSGEGYEVWVEAPAERVKFRTAVLQDHATAVFTLEDGRELLVDLVGNRQASHDENGSAIVTIALSDPAIAMLDTESIRARLKILPDFHWCAHWGDKNLIQHASAAAAQAAREALDGWDEATEAEFRALIPPGVNTEIIQKWRRETLLHQQVKFILEGAASIKTPSLEIDVRRAVPEELWDEGDDGEVRATWYSLNKVLTLSHVTLERRVGQIVPDVIATLNSQSAYVYGMTTVWVGEDFEEDIEDSFKSACPSTLLVEVTVTHGIDEEKLRRIRDLNVPTLEIDIGSLGGSVTLAGLRELVVNQIIGKRWVHHPLLAAKRRDLNTRIDAHPVTLQYAERLAKLRRPRLLATPATEWGTRYLAAVTKYHEAKIAIEKARMAHKRLGLKPEALGLDGEPWSEIVEAAEALAAHGFPGAAEQIMLNESGLVARILSIQQNRGIGYMVDTGYQVLNAIMQGRADNKQWDAVYAMAVKAYALEAKFNLKQAKRYADWRQTIIDEIKAGNAAYFRIKGCDGVLGVLFPELVPMLANGYGSKPANG